MGSSGNAVTTTNLAALSIVIGDCPTQRNSPDPTSLGSHRGEQRNRSCWDQLYYHTSLARQQGRCYITQAPRSKTTLPHRFPDTDKVPPTGKGKVSKHQKKQPYK